MKNISNPTSIKYRRVLVLFVLAVTLTLTPTPQSAAATAQRHFQASGASFAQDAPSFQGIGKKRVRPISGTYDTTFGAPTPLDPSTVLAVIKHHGSARPLGNFTGTIVQIVDFSDSSLQTLSTFITADGDVLRAIATGSFGQSSADVVTFEGFYEFTGGTGKFRDAKGTAYFTGSANLARGIGQVEFRGMISY